MKNTTKKVWSSPLLEMLDGANTAAGTIAPVSLEGSHSVSCHFGS